MDFGSPRDSDRLLNDHSHTVSPLILDDAVFRRQSSSSRLGSASSSSSSSSADSYHNMDEKDHIALTLPSDGGKLANNGRGPAWANRLVALTSPDPSSSTTTPTRALSWNLSRLLASRRIVVVFMLAIMSVLFFYDMVDSLSSGVKSRASDWSQSVKGWTSTRERGDGHDDRGKIWEPFNKSLVLNFDEPQETMFAQFKQGIRYTTSMSYGGHANQFISIQRIIYFGSLTGRVAIIPTLVPSHFSSQPVPMSEFFDVNRLWQETGIPMVEMSEFKAIDPDSSREHNEDISCWSIQEKTAGHANLGAGSMDVHDIWVNPWPLPDMKRANGGFDISFESAKLFDHDWWARAQWVDKVRKEFIPQRTGADKVEDKSKNLKDGFDPIGTNPPDDRLMCFDNTLFLGPVTFPPAIENALEADNQPNEEDSWKVVGQHIHFNEKVESIVDRYLMDIFAVSKPSKIPPFMTVHIRRGDFDSFGGYTDLEEFEAAVIRARERLQARISDPSSWSGPGRSHFETFGIGADKYEVLVATDEKKDSEFVDRVRALGWYVIDHDELGTVDRYGGWYPAMLDHAMLARGKAFVGTARSTFSALAAVRVKYWRGGPTEFAGH